MEEITIEKVGTTTIVKISEDGTIVRSLASNERTNYRTDTGSEKITFNDPNLNMLFISAKRLSQTTLDALTLTENSTIQEVFDAFTAGDFFTGN